MTFLFSPSFIIISSFFYDPFIILFLSLSFRNLPFGSSTALWLFLSLLIFFLLLRHFPLSLLSPSPSLTLLFSSSLLPLLKLFPLLHYFLLLPSSLPPPSFSSFIPLFPNSLRSLFKSHHSVSYNPLAFPFSPSLFFSLFLCHFTLSLLRYSLPHPSPLYPPPPFSSLFSPTSFVTSPPPSYLSLIIFSLFLRHFPFPFLLFPL